MLGIVIMVLGISSVCGYLDPEAKIMMVTTSPKAVAMLQAHAPLALVDPTVRPRSVALWRGEYSNYYYGFIRLLPLLLTFSVYIYKYVFLVYIYVCLYIYI